MTKLYLAPVDNAVLVPDPGEGDLLPLAGRWVTSNQYWLRRLAAGDVHEITPPAPPAPETATSVYTGRCGCPPLLAAITADKVGGNAPVNVAFADASSGAVLTRLWDFGDGATSTAALPVHTYTAEGAYTATLTVTDACGSTDTATYSITATAHVGLLLTGMGYLLTDPSGARLRI
jgi:PKD repeat protein